MTNPLELGFFGAQRARCHAAPLDWRGVKGTRVFGRTKGAGKMEQLPHWLTAAVLAAGMTAYADGLDGVHKDSPSPPDTSALDEPTPPLH